ncbi:unnamed protein product, partial [Larinioides sclopetarius]
MARQLGPNRFRHSTSVVDREMCCVLQIAHLKKSKTRSILLNNWQHIYWEKEMETSIDAHSYDLIFTQTSNDVSLETTQCFV